MTYDYVIVGAGSAGCVLANRLSANPAHRVLLLEAGGRDWHPFIHMPAGLGKLFALRDINWDYSTEPEPALQQRRLWWPRGHVLGGSSSINAMCYARGVAADYDEWAEATGDARWAWPSVLEVFKRGEDNARGADAWHGTGGPLTVSDLRHRNVLSQAFIDSAAAAGIARNDDFNGATQEGVGYYQVTQRDGLRCSAATAYLKPALARTNLQVRTRALTTRVVLDGARAVGVEYRHRGRLERVEAGQVLLCGGAINSPQLLMLSGIGPADELRRHGIPVALDARGVGADLQDHLDICTLVQSTREVTYDTDQRASRPPSMLEFLFAAHRGLGQQQHRRGGRVSCARRWRRRRTAADLQMHFVPALLDDHGRNKLAFPATGYTAARLLPAAAQPRSASCLRSVRTRRAEARIRGELPRRRGRLRPEDDGRGRRSLARETVRAGPRSTPYRGAAIHPGAAATLSEAELAAFVRRQGRDRSTTRSAPAAWAATTRPCSTPNCACAASMPCAWSTPRSCRA
jgi:choline dehydrogenase-like flavoprotein